MPSRFEKYRVKDGLTKLGEAFFNPVFQDIDLRLVGIEALRISWEDAVRSVTEYGLVRVNEVIGPTLIDAAAKAEQIEAKRQAASAALTVLMADIDSFEASANADILAWKNGVSADIAALAAVIATAESAAAADISAWKSAQLTALQTWKASFDGALPAIDSRLSSVESELPSKASASDLSALQAQVNAKMPLIVVPDDAGNFTISAGGDGQLAVVSGYGIYRFEAANTELSDGETVVAPSTGSGNWLLVSPHWDFVWSYLAEMFDNLGSNFLTGSATLDFPVLGASGGFAALSITVAGAETADRVILGAPAAWPSYLILRGYVSAPDVLTIAATNFTTGSIDPAAMNYLFTIIKP